MSVRSFRQTPANVGQIGNSDIFSGSVTGWQLALPFVWNAAGEVRIWTCNLGVYSDTFQLRHFEIVTLVYSNTFQFWHYPILTPSDYNTFIFWQFQLPILRPSQMYSCLYSHSLTACPSVRLKCCGGSQNLNMQSRCIFWHLHILTLSNYEIVTLVYSNTIQFWNFPNSDTCLLYTSPSPRD